MPQSDCAIITCRRQQVRLCGVPAHAVHICIMRLLVGAVQHKRQRRGGATAILRPHEERTHALRWSGRLFYEDPDRIVSAGRGHGSST